MSLCLIRLATSQIRYGSEIYCSKLDCCINAYCTIFSITKKKKIKKKNKKYAYCTSQTFIVMTQEKTLLTFMLYPKITNISIIEALYSYL